MDRLHPRGVALMFEGGGMRASYTCATAVTLMENGVDFDFVCGLSAGASNTVNYLSGDIARARRSFLEIVEDPKFGDWRTLLRGKGLFSAHWIYQEACLPDNSLPYDFDSFRRNPAQMAIQSFDAQTGQTVGVAQGGHGDPRATSWFAYGQAAPFPSSCRQFASTAIRSMTVGWGVAWRHTPRSCPRRRLPVRLCGAHAPARVSQVAARPDAAPRRRALSTSPLRA